MQKVPSQRQCTRSASRQGAALVELAFTLPLLLLLTFGAIEASNAIVLKQILTETAYETARMATNQGQTEADALLRAEEILTSRHVQDADVTISPTVTSSTPAGTEIEVTITAPAASNSLGPQWYFKDSTMSATVVMVRM